MPQTRVLQFLALCLILQVAPTLDGETIVYPDDADVIDVTRSPWYVDNTGTADVTAKLNEIFKYYADEGDGPHRIIYLPNGTYLVSDRLLTNQNTTGDSLGGFNLQGESREGVVLKLRDNTTGSGYTDAASEYIPTTGNFSDPANPLPVLSLFEGVSNNDAFYNSVENITIDTGSGNPGAIGLRFFNNNTGYIRNACIRTSDPSYEGVAGLDLRTRVNGQGTIKNLEVTGFDYGIWSSENDDGHPFAMEHIELSHQRVAGIYNDYRMLPIRGLISDNSVPAILHSDAHDLAQGGMVVLLDSTLSGGDPSNAAVVVEDGYLYLRNVSHSGYAAVANEKGSLLTGDYSAAEYISGPIARSWGNTPAASLNLPIVETPAVPWDAPADWYILEARGGGLDDTENIRAAMASGKRTIYFKKGTYRVSETITIGKNVRRIMGQWSDIHVSLPLRATSDPVFLFEQSNHAAVLIERFKTGFGFIDPAPHMVQHNSSADLVLRDIFWVQGPAYRNQPNGGRLFVEDVHTLPGTQTNVENRPAWIINQQEAWFRGVNPEMQTPHIVNNGGKVWIFGGKFGEETGPIVKTLNFGSTEILGALQNVTHDTIDVDPSEPAIIWTEDGHVSAIVVERAKQSWGAHPIVTREIRNGETRELLHSDFPKRNGDWQDNGVIVPFYAGYIDPDTTGNAPPQIEITASASSVFPHSLPLSANVSDDGAPTGALKTAWSKVSGPGSVSFEDFSDPDTTVQFSRPGDYVLQLEATDGLATVSASHNISATLGNMSLETSADSSLEDAFPQDGVADSLNTSTIRVGDGSENQLQYGMFDFNVRALEGQDTSIDQAMLQLHIKSLTGQVDEIQLYHLNDGYGQHQKADLEIPGTLVATVDVSTLGINNKVVFDVTASIQSAIAEGKSYANYRLQPTALSQDNAGDNLSFYTSQDATDYRPILEIHADAEAPANLTATADSLDFSRIDLNWIDNASDEQAYLIERKTGTGSWTQIASLPANTTHHTATGLSDATTYFFRVRASLAGALASSYSNTAAATTIANAPPADPTGLSIEVVSTGQINLTWTDNANNETSYVVERRVNAGSWEIRATLANNSVSFVDTEVNGDTSYEYRIYASNSAGDSASTSPVSGTTPTIDSIEPDLLHLKFEESSGTLAGDSSGNGKNFELFNMDFSENAYSSEGNTQSLSFTDWECLRHDDFSYGPDFSISIWFKIEDGNEGNSLKYLFSHGVSDPSEQYLHIAIGENNSFYGAGRIVTQLKDSSDIQNDEVMHIPLSTVDVADGQWHLYTLTVGAAGLINSRVYIDGTEYANSSQGGSIFNPVIDNSGERVRIGMRSSFNAASSFDGNLDDVRMFSRALSSEEIEILYELGPSGTGKAPKIPSQIAVSNVTGSSVTINWQDMDDMEDGFVIERKSSASWDALASVAAGSTSYVDDSVNPNKTYLYRVKASGTVADSEYSDVIAVVTQSGGIGLPAPWQGVDVGSVAIPGSESYSTSGDVYSVVSSGQKMSSNNDQARFVYRKMTGDGEFILQVPSFSSDAPSNARAGLMLRESLDPGARALFPHLEVDGDIQYYRRTSNGSSTTTGLANQATSNYFRIVRSGDVFTAYHSNNGSSWTEFDGINVENPVTLADMPATLYVGMVVAAGYDPADSSLNYVANAEFKNLSISPQAPEAPKALVATADGNQSVELTWGDFSDNEDQFLIERKAGLAGSWAEITGGLTAGTVSYSDTNITPFTTYYYRIWARNAVGDSTKSDQAFTTTGAAPAPTAPSSLSANAGSIGRIELSWTDAENESEYRIERKQGTSGVWSDIGVSIPGDSLSYSDFNLNAGTSYSYRIFARNPSGDSGYSNEVSAITQNAVSSLPASALTWYRGRTNSGSGLTQNGETLNFFSGTSNGDELHASLLSYYEAVSLADGETLRLSFEMSFSTLVPDIGQAVRFGFVDSQGTQYKADIGGNNHPDRRNDRGYGVALSSGSATNTRYIEEPGSVTATNPFIYDFTTVGDDPNTYGINDQATHPIVLDLTRDGTSLEMKVYFDGSSSPFDGGRSITTPETFTYDCVVFDVRSQDVNLVISDLKIEHYSEFTPSPLQSWRQTHFGSFEDALDAANTADPDADGLSNFAEYAMALDPNTADSSGSISASIVSLSEADYLSISFRRNQLATELNWVVEESSDLVVWTPVWDFSEGDHTYRVDSVDHGDGSESITVRQAEPTLDDKGFLRLRLEFNP